MNKRIWLLITVTVVLAGAYVVFFTDWLNPTPITILTELRMPSRFGRGGPGGPGGQRGNFRNGGDNSARPEARGGRGGQNRRNGQPGDQGGNRADAGGAEAGGRPRRQGGGNGGEAADKPTVYTVSFAFDDSYPLTSVKVVEAAKSGHPHVVWSLVNDGEPRGTKALVYGMAVRGMKFAPNYNRVEPLEAGVEYELQVAAGRHKGKVTFHTKELPPPEEPAPEN